jgi:hypothetical protein
MERTASFILRHNVRTDFVDGFYIAAVVDSWRFNLHFALAEFFLQRANDAET